MQRGVRLTTESFIDKAKLVHGEKYHYDTVVFSKTKEKVLIVCPKHGEFSQRADVHLAGHGCPKCSPFVKTSFKDFCARQQQVHGDFFTYIEESYNGLIPNMRIVCPIHGEFIKSPNNHLQGQSCPACNRDNLGLYILKCQYTDLVKIGVTSELHRRLKELPKTLSIVLWKPSANAFNIEATIHKQYNNSREDYPTYFGGSTEFFRLTDKELEQVLHYLKTV